jgi:hypothetical protein
MAYEKAARFVYSHSGSKTQERGAKNRPKPPWLLTKELLLYNTAQQNHPLSNPKIAQEWKGF